MNTEDLEEIEQETHEFFQSYLEKNIIELSHPDFFEKMVDSAAQTAFETVYVLDILTPKMKTHLTNFANKSAYSQIVT